MNILKKNINSISYFSFIHPDFTQFGETDTLLRIGKENGRWLCIDGHYTLLP